jgi:hypothetical protein
VPVGSEIANVRPPPTSIVSGSLAGFSTRLRSRGSRSSSGSATPAALHPEEDLVHAPRLERLAVRRQDQRAARRELVQLGQGADLARVEPHALGEALGGEVRPQPRLVRRPDVLAVGDLLVVRQEPDHRERRQRGDACEDEDPVVHANDAR